VQDQTALAVAVTPDPVPEVLAAVEAGGGRLVEPAEAEAVIWTDPRDADGLGALLADEGSHVGWVQLPYAGIERFAPVLDRERTWSCAKEIYGPQVAELALALLLAGFRHLGRYAAATKWRPLGDDRNLLRRRVVLLGGGGITTHLVEMLRPFGCHVTVVRRRVDPMAGVSEVVGPDDLDRVLTGADGLVVALALTPETMGIVAARQLELLDDGAWVVNVARGAHIVTDDLVAALQTGTVGGAGLDVTDPEPLPDGHPLWDLPNCIITPHVANTWEMAVPCLADQVAENVRRWSAGEPLLGPVDVDAGY
jgi:phosphoglycerate dehydrogenase-like enzyme